jgi:hypothetical protein
MGSIKQESIVAFKKLWVVACKPGEESLKEILSMINPIPMAMVPP